MYKNALHIFLISCILHIVYISAAGGSAEQLRRDRMNMIRTVNKIAAFLLSFALVLGMVAIGTAGLPKAQAQTGELEDFASKTTSVRAVTQTASKVLSSILDSESQDVQKILGTIEKVADSRVGDIPVYTYDVRNVLPKNAANTLLAPLSLLKLPADANDAKHMLGKVLSEYTSIAAGVILLALAEVFPEIEVPYKEEFDTSKNFYPGTAQFADKATQTYWSAGYASETVIPADFYDEDTAYTMAGYFNNLPANVATGVLDDQRFTAVALDTGNGKVLFCSLDGFGMTNANVKKLRSYLEEFAAKNNIVSINITCTHTHYALDTHGLGANMLDMLVKNLKNLALLRNDLISSTNEDFMNNLYSVAEKTIKAAVNSMQAGEMCYSETDIADLMKDKQLPDVYDTNTNVLRFVPAGDSANEIWLLNMGVHPTTMSSSSTEVSADYPGALQREAKKRGIDLAFYQGAQAAITREFNTINHLLPEEPTNTDRIELYAKVILDRVQKNNAWQKVAPILNIRHKVVYVPVNNALLIAACKLQLVNNTYVHTTGNMQDVLAVTEVGYCEIGENLAIMLVPGEMDPAIAFGGIRSAASWSGKGWEYPYLKDLTSRKLLVFGLTNDQIGYIVPDNDYANTFADLFSDLYPARDGHYEEMISLGKQSASSLVSAFAEMLKELN